MILKSVTDESPSKFGISSSESITASVRYRKFLKEDSDGSFSTSGTAPKCRKVRCGILSKIPSATVASLLLVKSPST